MNRAQRRQMIKQFRGRGKKRQTHLDRHEIAQVIEMKRRDTEMKRAGRQGISKKEVGTVDTLTK